jgi:hypothetical protein
LGWPPQAERLLCSRPLDPKSTQSLPRWAQEEEEEESNLIILKRPTHCRATPASTRQPTGLLMLPSTRPWCAGLHSQLVGSSNCPLGLGVLGVQTGYTHLELLPPTQCPAGGVGRAGRTVCQGREPIESVGYHAEVGWEHGEKAGRKRSTHIQTHTQVRG